MKHTKNTTRPFPKRIDRITSEIIDMVYTEEGEDWGQCIAALCLEASKDDLLELFIQLRKDNNVGLTVELAHILCSETRLCRTKKFTIKSHSPGSFSLFRSEVFLRTFEWVEPFFFSREEYLPKPRCNADIWDILEQVYPPFPEVTHLLEGTAECIE